MVIERHNEVTGRKEWAPIRMLLVDGVVTHAERVGTTAQEYPTQAYEHCAGEIRYMGSLHLAGSDLMTGELAQDRERREAKEAANG